MEHFDAYTIGFSNRSWEETVRILHAHRIECVIDIRTLPGSRRTPQFNLENLKEQLPRIGIDYVHLKSLGGLRKPVPGSTENAAWHNDGFRAYADYMQTPAFREALDELLKLVAMRRCVYACTEAVFWRCHRQLVSDALYIREFRIGHILGAAKVQLHNLTPFAKIEGLRITYPDLLRK